MKIIGKTRNGVDRVQFNLDKNGCITIVPHKHHNGTPQVPPCDKGGATIGLEHLYNNENNSENNTENKKESINQKIGEKPLGKKIITSKNVPNEYIQNNQTNESEKNDENLDTSKDTKFKVPRNWTVEQLEAYWIANYIEEFPDKAEPIITLKEQNYFCINANKVGLDAVAESIPIIIKDWSGLESYCKNLNIRHIPKTPRFNFFTRFLSEVVDFASEITQEIKKKKEARELRKQEEERRKRKEEEKRAERERIYNDPRFDSDGIFVPLPDDETFCVLGREKDTSYRIWKEGDIIFERKGLSYYRIAPDDQYYMPEIDFDELIGGSEQLLDCLKCKHLPDDDISCVPRDMDAYQRMKNQKKEMTAE